MSEFKKTQRDVDAWDHVYALGIEHGDEAFQIVRANVGRGITDETAGQLIVPEGVHMATYKAVDIVEAAIKTIMELDGKAIK